MNIIAEARRYEQDNREAWNDEHQARWDTMMADADKAKREMDRLQQMAAADEIAARLSEPVSRQIVTTPSGSPDSRFAVGDSMEYRNAMLSYLRTADPAEMRSLNVTVDPSGGYLVPNQMHNAFVSALNEYVAFRQYATVISTTGDYDIPVPNNDGVAYWLSEEGDRTESNETFGQRTLSAHYEGRLQKVSNALLQDSAYDIFGFLTVAFARAFSALEEPAFCTGNGVGKPKGFVTDATVGKTGAAATLTDSDELIDMLYSVKEVYRRRGVWVMADSTICLIRKMVDGLGNYVWQPGIAPGQPETLLAKPIIPCSSMAAVGSSTKPIAFGDFSFYWIADRGTPTLQRLVELYAANNQTGVLMQKRTDGLLTVTEAVKTFLMGP
jgi:HK97 family phage major capsid protein